MKTILSTLVAVGVLAGAANAEQPTFDPFNDTQLALPRAEAVVLEDSREALPKSGIVGNWEKPFPQDVFPDIEAANP